MFYRDMKGVSFVCLDDISGVPEPLNYVIYNPNVTDAKVLPVKLFNDVKEHFGVELTPSEVITLTSYDGNHLDEFTDVLRKIIKNKKRD